MGERAVNIIQDRELNTQEQVAIHIKYNEFLTLKEVSEVFDSINRSINDINRENGVKNNAKIGLEYATKVAGVDSGSIVLYIITNLILPIPLSVLGNCIYDRLKALHEKNKKKKNMENSSNFSISVNGNNNVIEVNINTPSDED